MLLDAAHNPAGAAALSRYLAEMYPAGLPLVFAVMRDKNVIGMLRHLLPHVTSLIATQPRTARAMPAEEIATAARTIAPNIPVEARPDVHRALEAAWARGTTVCVAGSIFLVGEVLEIIPASDVVSRLHDGVTDILRAGGSSRPSRG
jgi:dihydrofolate synthase/folylpolyglutamate synthase